MKPLVVIPTYVTKEEDVTLLTEVVAAAHETAGSPIDVLVVDDGSPEAAMIEAIDNPNFELHRKSANSGFSQTVNVGLKKALAEGRDAVLLNADVEMSTPNWVERCQAQKDEWGNPAALVGGLLIYPQNGLIQHAGIYFSLLTRRFGEMFKYGPANLPAALHRRAVPVTGAFHYIRHETLEKVGLYDEEFKLGWEDVDYCIRVFLTGEMQCIYTPDVRGWHAESMFRGEKTEKVQRWEVGSFAYFARKYASQSFAEFVPFW